jgi:putative glycosyltransferase (TIGR04372 family)
MLSQFVDTLRKANRLVVGGMFYFDSPGHMLAESDLLLRLLRHVPELKTRSPVVLLPPTPMAQMIAEILKRHGVQVLLEQQAILLQREIQIFHPDLILDVGQAHWKLAIGDRENRGVGDMYPTCLAWALRADEFIDQIITHHSAWNVTRGTFPMREAVDALPFDPEFAQFLSGRKYAVLQIKARVINGTARILGGEAYVPTLELLRERGYEIILGGREPLLDEFKRFDVFDYARSKFVSPKNDFLLFARAALGIVSPSGAGLFCDTLGIPCCQLGTWTLIPHPSEKTTAVPSRLKDLKASRTLTFTEQVTAFRNAYHPVTGPMIFDAKTYEDLPPSPEDIRNGVADTLAAVPAQASDTASMQRLRAIDPTGMWKAAASRISPSFLARHPEYIG